ncbi:MAG: HAD family hydrolase [Thermomicrobiales bacterium]|nr:MAG: HAD family hydrolase [Thermomicrobiales bacterium]
MDPLTTATDRPIELVTFDLYDTLIELHPKRWERLQRALRRIGIESDLEALRRSDLIAEDYFTIVNGAIPIRDRPPADRERIRLEYMNVWLEAAGIPHDELVVRSARQHYLAEYETPAVEDSPFGGYLVFRDVMDATSRLREAGIKTAIISNADSDVTALCQHLEFAEGMDLIVTSALIGYEKPHINTFRAAFEPLGVDPANALHIGDQPKSDVVGARNAGMRAALIDRYERHDPALHDVPIFVGLDQLVDHVLAVNEQAAVAS